MKSRIMIYVAMAFLMLSIAYAPDGTGVVPPTGDQTIMRYYPMELHDNGYDLDEFRTGADLVACSGQTPRNDSNVNCAYENCTNFTNRIGSYGNGCSGIPIGSHFSAGTNYSINLWFMTPDPRPSTTQLLFQHDTNESCAIGLSSSGYIRYYEAFETEIPTMEFSSIIGDVWYMVTIVSNATLDDSLYINGELISTKISEHECDFWYEHIGGYDNGGASFNGTIDEVMVWNRTLSGQEIRGIYADGFYGSGGWCNPYFQTCVALPVIQYFDTSASYAGEGIPITWDIEVDWTPESDTYLALDCDNNGDLEYGWGQFGNTISWDCTYYGVGTHTATLYTTNPDYYLVQNNSLSQTIEVIAGDTIDSTCDDFVTPPCTGTCWFYDDFAYTSPITCNDWINREDIPESGAVRIDDIQISDMLYNFQDSALTKSAYKTWGGFLKINMSQNLGNLNFRVMDKNIEDTIFYLTFTSTGDLIVRDGSYPYTEQIGTYPDNAEVRIDFDVNWNTNKITWSVDGGSEVETQLFDSDVSSLGYMSFDWNELSVNFSMNEVYFQKRFVQTQEEFINDVDSEFENITEKLTYLDTGNFCAINWSNNDFLEAECVTRGYNDSAIGLNFCLVGSCVGDTFAWAYSRAQLNIYKTIVIILIFLLLAPLFVALMRRR